MFSRVQTGVSQKMVASPRQEAILCTDGQTVQVMLRTYFRAGPEELAWIVPVPAKPRDIRPADEKLFDFLEEHTAPRFYGSHNGLPFGCACAAASIAVSSNKLLVRVEETGTAGVFQYAVLSAEDGDALAKWLNDNRYTTPIGAERVFKKYVGRGWYWLAMRIRPEAAKQPTLAPHPITYTYTDDKLVYPLEISQLSADLENEILLYVVAANRYACANWTNTTITELTDKGKKLKAGDEQGDRAYERLFRAESAKHRGRLFVTEFSGRLGSARSDRTTDSASRSLYEEITARDNIVTRLRALMHAGAMTRDVVLIPVLAQEPINNNLKLALGGKSVNLGRNLEMAVMGLAGFLAVFGLHMIHRPSRMCVTGWLCAATGAVMLCMV